MAANGKDTIYIDVDDEITTIIDKVRSSEGRVVALVLPKRAAVFQSIVNMKLLKRTADSARKHIVLITTESSLMPLAGAVGLHVAATPSSKPEIPSIAQAGSSGNDIVEASSDDDAEYTADNAGDRPVGELAGGMPDGEPIETLRLPDEQDDMEVAEDDQPKASSKPAKDKHLKVPNFNTFRLRLFIGVLALIIVIAGLYVCLAVLPKAAIAITTNSSDENVNLALTLDTAAKTLDTSKKVAPAKIEQQQKTTTQQVDTTGQKNTGTAATGTVVMNATACFPHIGTPNSVAAGTGVTTNELTFITQEKATFNYNGNDGAGCNYYKSDPVDITAQTGGTKYNVSNATFTVAGRSDVSATGSASGGTDNIIHVVAQGDIDSAKQKLAAADTATIKSALEQALRLDGLYPLSATFNAGDPVITTSNNVGDQADTVTVTQAVTYTMYGAKQADLDTLIKADVDTKIDTSKQSILDDGLGNATVNVVSSGTGSVQLTLQTTATVGPDINTEDIKKQAAGKKSGDVKSSINAIPGVSSVDVQLSPFWVGTVPTNTSKITVTVSGDNSGSHANGS